MAPDCTGSRRLLHFWWPTVGPGVTPNSLICSWRLPQQPRWRCCADSAAASLASRCQSLTSGFPPGSETCHSLKNSLLPTFGVSNPSVKLWRGRRQRVETAASDWLLLRERLNQTKTGEKLVSPPETSVSACEVVYLEQRCPLCCRSFLPTDASFFI